MFFQHPSNNDSFIDFFYELENYFAIFSTTLKVPWMYIIYSFNQWIVM